MKARICLLFLLELTAARFALGQSWTSQGPGPTLNGQTEGIGDNPVSGAIDAIALTPNPNVIYVGTVNGGVWETTNATFLRPTWTQLTDLKLPALSINSLAISPTDANTLFAGTGSTSAFGGDGSPGFGIGKSTDGGATWQVLAAGTFAGKPINSIVPTAASGGTVVMAAALGKTGGVFRSTDAAETFTRISGAQGSGLPDAGASRVVEDPMYPGRLYAAVPGASVNSGSPGIYVSVNDGVTWAKASGGIPSGILRNSVRVLLAVSKASPNPVYAMFIAPTGTGATAGPRATGVFRSADAGATWISMGVPTPDLFPGGQGDIHGAIAASPTNSNVVWVGGDRQDLPVTGGSNESGCRDFSASVDRGDFSVLGSQSASQTNNPWSVAVCNGANGSSPHADSRDMVFDQDGTLLLANDAGISRLVAPDNATLRRWIDVNGDIQPTEIHSVAYDPLSNVLLAGTQDTGTPIQSAPGSVVWSDFTKGDGGVVAVDADQNAHPGVSLRYTSNFLLGNFTRTTFDNHGNPLAQSMIGLLITSGHGSGLTLDNFDRGLPFYTPYALNKIDPSRMLIAGSDLYESFDRGDTLTNLGLATNPGSITTSFCAVTYGGKTGGVANPDVIYAGTGSRLGICGVKRFVVEGPPSLTHANAGTATTGAIFHRTVLGGAMTRLSSYPGSGVVRMAIDPQNFKRVFVLDDENRVWGSFDEGATWSELTKNLPAETSAVRSVEVFTPSAGGNTVLLAGTMNGVFQMPNPETGSWTLLGTGLPHALAFDIHYDFTNQVLVAGTLGRGAWLLNNPFSQPLSAEVRRLMQEPRVNVAPVKPLLNLPPPPPLAAPRR